MDATGHRNAVWRDHIELHAMFIHLDQLCWSGNGEGKRAWGLPITLESGQLFALLAYLRFLFEGLYIGSELVVGRQRVGRSSVRLDWGSDPLELGMLSDGADLEPGRTSVNAFKTYCKYG